MSKFGGYDKSFGYDYDVQKQPKMTVLRALLANY